METEYILYQTLQDKNNYIECEENGPFSCEWENTWLGKGFYFWFHHIELAKWWGNVKPTYKKNGFVIFKTVCKDVSKCWDLHANPAHQEEFKKWIKFMTAKGLIDKTTTVLSIIEFIKSESEEFKCKYDAIRILGSDSISTQYDKSNEMPRFKFEKPRENDKPEKQRFLAYFDAIPPVQVCLFNKNSLLREGFDVVYPDRYKKENRAITEFFI